MRLTMRTAHRENDYWRIREFLREVFMLNGRRELSWQVYRFDCWRWHGFENMGHHCMEEDVFLWETDGGRIAAVLNPEGRGQAFLQVHPRHRTLGLEEEMLLVAEKHLAHGHPDGRHKLRVWAHEQDDLRKDILTRHGYTKGDEPEYQRRRPLSGVRVQGRFRMGRYRRDTSCVHWGMSRTFPRAVTCRGRHSIPMSPTISTMGGSGIVISSVHRSTAAIWIWWL